MNKREIEIEKEKKMKGNFTQRKMMLECLRIEFSTLSALLPWRVLTLFVKQQWIFNGFPDDKISSRYRSLQLKNHRFIQCAYKLMVLGDLT